MSAPPVFHSSRGIHQRQHVNLNPHTPHTSPAASASTTQSVCPAPAIPPHPPPPSLTPPSLLSGEQRRRKRTATSHRQPPLTPVREGCGPHRIRPSSSAEYRKGGGGQPAGLHQSTGQCLRKGGWRQAVVVEGRDPRTPSTQAGRACALVALSGRRASGQDARHRRGGASPPRNSVDLGG